MSTVISVLLGVLIVFPFLLTFLILIFFRRRGRAPVTVIGLAADLTTPFLFLAVYIIFRAIFDKGVGVYIAVIAIVITIVYAFLERFKVKDFQIVRLLRKTWRLLFLILAAAYFILLIIGMVLKIMDSLN
ncbi:DUF3397 domain-containing protein [Sporosarcina siberiensis]|uniref:DUF3397 domain-containing protein n=1 Tax=Sporosarcina siberiensis TaxID=1365606 RepID=A0ABW4SJ04_9BACL